MEERRSPDRRELPEAISIQLAAQLLDVHCLTIRRWIRKRIIKAYRVGPKLIRIPRSEISRLRTLRLLYKVEGDLPKYPSV